MNMNMGSKATAHPKVCIIGAGSSGVTMAKHLLEREIAFDCFEGGSKLGGMWRYQNDNGMSSAYASLHIDTSRQNLGYSDFPIASDLPDFLSHAQFLKHLEDYAETNDVTRHVTFSTTVEKAVQAEDGGWTVHLSTGEVRHYQYLVVANGHLWDPRMPAFPGTFNGEVIHSHHYRTAAQFEGKSVLVVGLGNSAVDIAVDLARRAKSVTVSTRSSAWIMPKYLMGIPVDRWSSFLSRRFGLPTRLTRMIMARLIRLGVGDQRRFGLKRPKHPMWREHATLSQELLPYIGHGYIKVAPNVVSLNGDRVAFEDGATQAFDAIIYATGYKTTFPFFEQAVFDPDGDVSNLYRRIVSASRRNLAFIGLLQPVGPTIPLVEIQAKWLAAVLAREIAMPDAEAQRREIDNHRKRQQATYLNSARYTLEVDFASYAGELRRDLTSASTGKKIPAV